MRDSTYLTLFGKVVALATLLTQPIRLLDSYVTIVVIHEWVYDFTLCRYIVHASVSTAEEHQTGTNFTALESSVCKQRLSYQAGYFSIQKVDDNF